MPRPPKFRRVEWMPEVTSFKPVGGSEKQAEEVVLNVEELEAVRLKDIEGLEQEECAERMGISRPTFQRVLTSARKKMASAFVEGRPITVSGGHYRLAMRRFGCRNCGNEFEVPFGTGQRGIDMKCPSCGEQSVHRIDQGGHGFGNMPWGRRRSAPDSGPSERK